MWKIKKQIMLLCLGASSLFIGASYISAEVSFSPVQQSEKTLPLDKINQLAAAQGLPKLDNAQIPTFSQLNQALTNIHVSPIHPIQTTDLGNGFSITAQIHILKASKNVTLSNLATASGEISYKMGTASLYTLQIYEQFVYDFRTITFYSKKPTVEADGTLMEMPGTITEQFIKSVNPIEKDAIGEATYAYIGGKPQVTGHIELRFTGKGNYYIHDSYFHTTNSITWSEK
ncbi:hypothetical protein [Bacillus toyonensis]|uniref:hypothetical protein n=1 Tax=Bacillus toyonensis TaxID=155322 RepID=UPI00119F4729|nr:hypothetical protein [Bacillus toyonensis]